MKKDVPLKPGRTSLTEQITTELRRRILNGQLAEGTMLRQERLASELGVSRIPLREAIRHLEAEGLVTSELHKGTVVSSLSPRELEDLFGIRMQLETWLFEAAIPRATDADLDRAEALIDEASRTGAVDNWGDLNWRFHEALYLPSGNRVALKLLRSVHDNAARYVNLQLFVMRDVESELSDHHAMLAYARLRDVERGVDVLRRHIARVSRNLSASLAAAAEKPLKDIA
ncbi:GntR family transcriptional regulator [Lichenifustis flavocetrariae]|uniref:GntR family transcriptional regulator n=1 Tax=Lichenifustis flavocetrariae TaxID=2949735 RepID=A0AA41Z8W5_9HYPH|nr:GntR family transcriptional regulator [Lichenifustis flavocetrariae]MCW6511487.1 GntR family transcriptional regulator [Lichenifustis flavocetrariae]